VVVPLYCASHSLQGSARELTLHELLSKALPMPATIALCRHVIIAVRGERRALTTKVRTVVEIPV